ncbi:MAG: prolipoprotein diacylglyceryl transferase [Chloroflexi bacterium]|nr:prolipoprotein diacylglyceryl transferase [Chloroflexota bacterium]
MTPNPVFLRLGPINVYWYGVLIVSGAMLAAYLVSKLSSRNGHDPEIAWNLLIVALFTGIIGARLYHIASSWEYYSQNPSEMFGLQMSGFGIFGAVAGGAVGLYFFTRIKHLRFLEWIDYVSPGLLIAQAIGRWGNFFNQELYGPPTDLPWAIYIAPSHRLPGFESFEYFHPTFLYESLLNLAGGLLLLHLARRWKQGRLYGDIFFLYAMIYSAIRYFIEGNFRPDAWKIGGIPTAQIVSVVVFVIFGALMYIRHRLRRPSMIYQEGVPWAYPEAEAPSGGTKGQA